MLIDDVLSFWSLTRLDSSGDITCIVIPLDSTADHSADVVEQSAEIVHQPTERLASRLIDIPLQWLNTSFGFQGGK